MAGRTNSQGINDVEFSRLMQALSATPKGRSFLGEYRKRVRPEETGSLLDALERIESTIAALRDQLQPERIADELRRIGVTLEFAIEAAGAGRDDGDTRRQLALVARARSELSALAEGLAGRRAPPAIDLGANFAPDHLPNLGGSAESRRALLRQAAEETVNLFPDL